MTSHSSAGVYVTENDDSQRAAPASTSIGAIVGESKRGPLGQRTLITSTKQFLATFGKPDATLTFMHHCALAFLEQGAPLYVTRVAPGALFGGAVVSTENNLNVIAPVAAGMVDPGIYDFAASDLFLVHAVDQGTWNNDIHVYVYPNTRLDDNTFYVDVYIRGQGRPVEQHLVHMDFQLDGYGVQQNVQEYINRRSAYIRIVQNYDNADYVTNPKRQFINTLTVQYLEHGGDAVRKATASDIIGNDSVGGVRGWNLYSDVEQVDVNMLINGGYTDVSIQRAMTAMCESRMDCIAILDTPSDRQRVADALAYRRNELMLDSSYAALYTPDYMVMDNYNAVQLYVPPSGHVAAAYARTDREKALWFAPAGMDQGKLNVKGVRHVYNQEDRDMLYDSQLNATRVIQGAGIKIWGADTLQTKASALSNVSVRRLMIFLEKSLSLACLYSVFDPNDTILRNKLKDICDRFLKPIQNAEGMYDFNVQCDEFNNPPEMTASGDLILEVRIDPVLPAKRIFLTAIIQKTGAKFTQS